MLHFPSAIYARACVAGQAACPEKRAFNMAAAKAAAELMTSPRGALS